MIEPSDGGNNKKRSADGKSKRMKMKNEYVVDAVMKLLIHFPKEKCVGKDLTVLAVNMSVRTIGYVNNLE